MHWRWKLQDVLMKVYASFLFKFYKDFRFYLSLLSQYTINAALCLKPNKNNTLKVIICIMISFASLNIT